MDITETILAAQEFTKIKDEEKINWTAREKKLASFIQLYSHQLTDFETRLRGQEFLVQKIQELKTENETLKQKNYSKEQSLRDAQDKLKTMVQEPKKALTIFQDRSVMRVLDSYIAENKILKEQASSITGCPDGAQLLQQVKADHDLIHTLQKQLNHTEEEVVILRSIIDTEDPSNDSNTTEESSNKNETIRQNNRKILRLKKKVMNLADNNKQLQQRCVNQAQLIATETGIVRHLQARLQELVVDFRQEFEKVYDEHGRDINQFIDDDSISKLQCTEQKCEQSSFFEELFAPNEDSTNNNNTPVQALEAENNRLQSQITEYEQSMAAMSERIGNLEKELTKKEMETQEQVKLLNQLSRMEQTAVQDKTILENEVESWRAAVEASQSDARDLQQQNSKLEKKVQQLEKELQKWSQFREKDGGSQSPTQREVISRTNSYTNRRQSPPPNTFNNDFVDASLQAALSNTRIPSQSLQETQRYESPREPYQQSLPWNNNPYREDIVVADGGRPYNRNVSDSTDDGRELVAGASYSPRHHSNNSYRQSSNDTETFRCEFCHGNYPYPTIMEHLKSCRDRKPSE